MNLMTAAVDLLLGAACPSCGTPGWGACAECVSQLNLEPHRVTRRIPAGISPAHGEFETWVGTDYAPPIDEFIVAYKDRSMRSLVKVLAGCLAVVVDELIPWLADELAAGSPAGLRFEPGLWLVPMPSSRAALQERGFDQLAGVTKHVSQICAVPVSPLLRRIRSPRDQLGLSRVSRWTSQAGSMRAKAGNKQVILLDDVLTTGATIYEGTRALESAGHRVLARACIAAVG